eukprot:1963566-Pyramimonas_sp.AAC.1
MDALMPGSGLRRSAPKHARATEKFKPSHDELQARLSNPTRLFEGVREWWAPEARKILDRTANRGGAFMLADLRLRTMMGERAVSGMVDCKTHASKCRMLPSKINVAGAPCVDWSPTRLGTGANGDAARAFA